MDEYLLPQFQVNEAYRPKKHKRGGVAGFWDRNKGAIAPLATLAAGALGGPAAAAALGAAMGGFDRPGKGGIGVDAGGAVRGGLQGYTMGRFGQAGADKLRGLFTPSSATASTAPASTAAVTRTSADARGLMAGAGDQGDLVAQAMQSGRALPVTDTVPTFTPVDASQRIAAASRVPTAVTPQIASVPIAEPLPTFTPSARLSLPAAPTPMPTPSKFSLAGLFKPGGLIYENPEVSAGIAQGLIGAYGSAQEREMERELINRQRRQQERLAALLMPMYTQYGGFGG